LLKIVLSLIHPPGLQQLDRAQEEASLDLGANYWQTFWRITVPNLKLPIVGAALLIFTLSMDEIAVSLFLIGRDNTQPLEICGRLRRGITPEINAISTIIFSVFAGGDCVLVPIAGKGGRNAGDWGRVGRNCRALIPDFRFDMLAD
jgi:ABC-type spermidine/putrescine transport system permease subunit II